MGNSVVQLANPGSLAGAGWREILLPRDASADKKECVDEGASTQDVAVVSTALSDDVTRGLDVLTAGDSGRLASIVTATWGLVTSRLTGETGIRVIRSRGDVADLTSEAGVAALVDAARVALLDVDGAEVFEGWLARVALDERELAAFQDSEATCAVPLHSGQAASRSILLMLGPNAGRDALASTAKSAARWSGFPLTLMVGFGSCIEIHLGYDSRIEAAMARDLLDYFSIALEGVARAPQQRLDEIQLVDAARLELMLERWNDTDVEYKVTATVPELFHDQVSQSPDATALVFDGGALSYSELDQRANHIAHILRAAGVAREVPVALCVARSPESIVAVLGILKAGGVYVPLEPSYPEERLAFMLRDAGVTIVLSEASVAARLPATGYHVILLDDIDKVDAQRSSEPVAAGTCATDRAYIMYTSGSTGTPKGVEITHRSINRLVCAVDYVELGPSHTVLHAAPLAFDASTFEIWGPLLTGGRCAVYRDRIPTPAGVARAISELRVTTAWLTAGLFNSIIDDDGSQLRGLSQLLVGGEVLSVPHIRRALELLPDTQLINGYGPTESTTFAVTYRIPRGLPDDLASIPIGRPIRDTRLYIVDGRGQPVPVGVEGELLIGGEGLARGYVGLPGLDGKRFGPNPFRAGAGERVYRTGDIARYLGDGTVVFAGRKDTQIKLSGYRIELGEIEAVLARHPSVKRAIVTAHDADGKLSGQLVAYLIARESGAGPDARAMRDYLRKTLPDYMVPSAYVWVHSLPLTPNGKLDIKALRKPELGDRAAEAVFVQPRTDIESRLCDTWGRLLDLPRIGIHDNVFDLGASSLLVLKAVAAIRREHNLTIPVVSFFRYPTVSSLAASLDGDSLIKPPVREKSNPAPSSVDGPDELVDAIAIVGMAGRYPGSASIDEFWSNIRDGKETITRFAEHELDPGLDPRLRNDPQYIRARGILPGVDMFDAGFFGMSPREAQLMDPQQRVFLEIAWEALENAGHVPDTFAGPIGVFAGVYNNSYVSTVLNRRPELAEQFGAFNAMLLNEKDYVATRTAHKLGLTGPALSIHSACSTSLVTICQAVQSLRAGQCDMALAGGVSLTLPTNSGYLYQEGSMLSVDGSTRAFDARATGTVFSDGAGVVVLKRLRDAVADGNRIYAVVRGVGINNDGAHKASFTAPSVDGQVAVIKMAQADARVHPRSISYVEAHGTATPLGDPIEFEALKEVFGSRTDDKQFCALGSVKSNVGHTVIAAGAAGVIKTALALTHESIPPTLHYTSANKSIDFENSPFFVNASARSWPRSSTPRRAGVSSFGVGGTNAHVVLEEAPAAQASGAGRTSQLLVISARTSAALEESTTNLVRYLREHSDGNLADIAYTLQVGRKHFLYRRALACTSAADGADALDSRDERRITTRQSPSTQPRVVFMFPGQGAQYPGMGADLYATEPVFREAFDRCASAAESVVGLDLRKLLFEQSGSEEDDAVLRQTAITQPALFAVEYSLATLWQAWGIRPAAMIGHSVGEFVCATLAGVFSVEDGMRLVAERGRVMQSMPQGAMLSVRASASDLVSMMGKELSLASDNAPSLCVVGGTFEAVANLEARLGKEGISCRLLQTSHAFHSPMMDPAVDMFGEILAGVTLNAPSIPFVSTVTGDWITAADAQNGRYWARHLRETVRFATGIRTLLEGGPCLLLEVGPRASLSALARQQIKDKSTQSCVASLGTVGDRNGEDIRVTMALGELWSGGVPPDWQACHRGEIRHRVPLPTYPFERQRHWVDPAGKSGNPVAGAAPQPSAPAASISAPKMAAPARVVASIAPITAIPQTPMPISTGRRDRLISGLREKLEQVSGQEVGPDETKSSFVELGFDSLVLTQVALALSKTHGVKITFRQLLEEYTSVERLAQHLDAVLPADAATEPAAPTPQPAPAQASAPTDVQMPAMAPIGQSVVQQLVEQQLRVMAQQLALLSGSAPAIGATAAEPKSGKDVSNAQVEALPTPVSSQKEDGVLSTGPNREVYDAKKAFGAAPRITLTRSDDLTPKQRARLDALVRRYTTRTQESKKFTQAHRARMADPRVAGGFRPTAKELVYPIVMDRSLGSKMWDIDGNEYVDVLSGFGSNFFGWSPEFIVDAIKAQLEKGFDVGPQNPLAGEVAELFCELTQNERAAFCNTGSEAVLGAIRIARTVTGRDTIVIFTGSYHGINDEVIVRATKKLGAVPAAPGIMAATAKNVLVLDYGTPESLEIIRSRASQLAAVVVEPVQSRRPDFQPGQFLQDLRKITEESGVVYIWDEIVTGFRVAPRGAQEYFGIKPDLSTYGKVVGGGLPIGVIAGRREFMDALDGGQWQYGDQSVPEVGVTYFAGTFVRHPLALAAARAVLRHLKARGPALQAEISGRTKALVTELNEYFQAEGAPLEIKYFSSIWKTFFKGEHPHGDLLFYMLRDRGLHIYDGFPCFMTAAHTDADVAKIVSIFKDAVLEMRESGFLPGGASTQQTRNFDGGEPPVAGAQLGRDRDGKPAWFVATASGKYAKVESTG